MEIMVIFLWILFSFVVAVIGSGKQIGGFASFLISLLLSPIIGFIAVIFSNSKIDIEIEKIAKEKKHNDQMKELKKISKQNSTPSMADELIKIKELYEGGTLNEEEYSRAKESIIGKVPLK